LDSMQKNRNAAYLTPISTPCDGGMVLTAAGIQICNSSIGSSVQPLNQQTSQQQQ
jgi:hypothetical protein